MKRYLVQRILSSIPVMLIVAVLTFSLIHLAPGDPAALMAGIEAQEAEIEEIPQKEYNEKITIEEGLGIAMRALNKLLEKRLNLERIEAACIRKSDRKFTKLSPDDIEKALKKK